MKTVKLKMFDRRHSDRSIAWAEDYEGMRTAPVIQPGDMVTTRYQGSTVVMKVLKVLDEKELKAEVTGFEDNAFPVNHILAEGTKIRFGKDSVFTCESG